MGDIMSYVGICLDTMVMREVASLRIKSDIKYTNMRKKGKFYFHGNLLYDLSGIR